LLCINSNISRFIDATAIKITVPVYCLLLVAVDSWLVVRATSSLLLTQQPSSFNFAVAYCRLGWVDFDENLILNQSTPGIYSFLYKSTENSKKKFFGQVTF
jgi:type III secretory pathway component EscR